ncbi:hypothetical protein EU803_14900 [Loktanella sp. IMCC34160]|uniref:hypothetical protein n=1 Tax=Loktanella sp. IMCC34160 TaxID=2510646 RepID=UPI0010E058DC|nr:hypothetical protein [Loktanella sp. IMCC34160]RYG89909.1 hypothetical protein EU803_14900 [Loktanella sp. IMCC34160]
MVVTASPALAQDVRQQAGEAVQSLGPVTDLLTAETLEGTVTPYETANPEEVQLSPYDFEDAIFEERTSDSDASRAFGASLDSALTRPEVDLGADPLGLADEAVAQSDAVTSGLFEGASSCQAGFEGGVYTATLRCLRDLTADLRTCSETRQVSLDRLDTWSCAAEATDYNKACARPVSWSCTGQTGASCVRQGLTFSVPRQWNAATSEARVDLTDQSSGSCSLKVDSFTVEARDWLSFSELLIRQVRASGTSQIAVNGQVVWTWGTAATGDLQFGRRLVGYGWRPGSVSYVDAAYAGATWIEDCTDEPRLPSVGVDLLSDLTPLHPGPSTIAGTEVVLDTGASGTLNIELRRVNRVDSAPAVWIRQGSSCCSAFTADLGGAC